MLASRIPRFRAAVVAEMRAILKADQADANPLHRLMHYHMGWVDADFRPIQVKTGKMIRPILTLLICEAAGGNWQAAVPAAAAIELLHNFSLIHDDIEDGSPTRHGRTTLWKQWGIPLAINAGDAMFASAQLAIGRLRDAELANEIVLNAFCRLNKTCIELTTGQHADMSFETQKDVSVAEYVAMIWGKTAVLLALSAELGASVAGASPQVIKHYYQFGLQTGLAFQIIDDILGVWGDEGAIGKSAESDILTKKKTLPVLYGLANSAELRTHYRGNSAEAGFVTTAVNLLNAAGARTFAQVEADRYTASALDHLQAAKPQGEAAIALDQLTALLLKRNF